MPEGLCDPDVNRRPGQTDALAPAFKKADYQVPQNRLYRVLIIINLLCQTYFQARGRQVAYQHNAWRLHHEQADHSFTCIDTDDCINDSNRHGGRTHEAPSGRHDERTDSERQCVGRANICSWRGRFCPPAERGRVCSCWPLVSPSYPRRENAATYSGRSLHLRQRLKKPHHAYLIALAQVCLGGQCSSAAGAAADDLRRSS